MDEIANANNKTLADNGPSQTKHIPDPSDANNKFLAVNGPSLAKKSLVHRCRLKVFW